MKYICRKIWLFIQKLLYAFIKAVFFKFEKNKCKINNCDILKILHKYICTGSQNASFYYCHIKHVKHMVKNVSVISEFSVFDPMRTIHIKIILCSINVDIIKYLVTQTAFNNKRNPCKLINIKGHEETNVMITNNYDIYI